MHHSLHRARQHWQRLSQRQLRQLRRLQRWVQQVGLRLSQWQMVSLLLGPRRYCLRV